MSHSTILAAACALGLAAAPAAAATLVVCTEASPAQFNPQHSTNGTDFDIAAQIYDELVETERGGSRILPGLAESWTVAPDGLAVTFHLRHNVEFHTNRFFKPTRPMNADDVAFSFARQADASHPFHPVGGGAYDEWDSLLRDRVGGVVKVADDAVRIDLKEPVAPLLGILSMQSFAIQSAEYAAAMQAAGTPDRVDTDPIGTGAFAFTRYQRDNDVRFTAFPHHWARRAGMTDRTAAVDSLVFSIVSDAAVRLAKLRVGECQIARYPNPADYDAIRGNPDLSLASAPMASIGYIAFRADRPPFDKLDVRQALAMAIDLKSLVASVFQGAGEPATALIPPAMWGHNSRIQPRPYDPDAARALLAKAGYPNGFKTQLWAIPVIRAYMPNGRRAAEIIQADWAKIGVQVDIVTYEWGEYLRRVRSGEAPVGMLGGSWDYPDPSQLVYGYWACPSGEPRPGNWSRWCNAAFSDLVSKANVTSDQAERTRLYEQAQEIFASDIPAVQFANIEAYTAIRKGVTGYKVHVLGGTPLAGVSLAK